MSEDLGLWFDPSKCLIAGEWVAPSGGQYLPLENPSTGEVIGQIARGTGADIDAAVAAAEAARHGPWGRMSAAERGRILMTLGRMVLERVDDLARIEALDVGKPLKQARADAVALARYMEFYGGAADKLHGETIPYLDGYTVYTLREPHGVTGHIVPWNYPMQIIGRSVGAALATGNACVLKPAEDACLTALAFAEMAKAAGLPDGALNVVPGLGSEAGAALSAHPGRAPHQLYRVGRHRRDGAGGRGEERDPRDAGTGRQIPAGRVRGCRYRRRPAVSGQCRYPERRTDLFRLLAHPGAAQRL